MLIFGDKGELVLTEAGLYAVFEYSFSGRAPVSRLWLICEHGRINLGVPAPQGERMALRRRVPRRELDALGSPLRFELVPSGCETAEKMLPIGEDGEFPLVEWFRRGKIREHEGKKYVVYKLRGEKIEF